VKPILSRVAEPLLTNLSVNMMMDGGSMMGMMIFMFLFGLLLIVLFVVIVVALVNWLLGSKMPFLMNDRENHLEILKKRYAKGEISREEFEAIRRDIEK
jgi:putative membrane protein